jgi:hypothetical protein
MIRAFASVFAAGVLGLVLVPSTAYAASPLQGDVDPALPTPLPSGVAVVAHGAPVKGDVAIIVRNGTDRPVDDVVVSATASRPDRGPVVRAKTKSVVPNTLAPGELAIGKLDFRVRDLPSDTSFAFKVESSRAKSVTDRGSLEVRDPSLSRPMEGPVAQELGLTLANPAKRAFDGTILITVMCFGEARNPALVASATLKSAHLAAGATMPASVKFRELCPSYLVGARAA